MNLTDAEPQSPKPSLTAVPLKSLQRVTQFTIRVRPAILNLKKEQGLYFGRKRIAESQA
jgi:hypothetical protein